MPTATSIESIIFIIANCSLKSLVCNLSLINNLVYFINLEFHCEYNDDKGSKVRNWDCGDM